MDEGMLQDFPGVPQLVAHFRQDHSEGLHDGDDPPELRVVAGLALSHNGTRVLLLPLQDLPCSSLFRPHAFQFNFLSWAARYGAQSTSNTSAWVSLSTGV